MASIFDLTRHDLEKLTPDMAVRFFAELLWAEANRLGISKSLINVPQNICVKDGGVDADTINVSGIDETGLIRNGMTRYQIKKGDFKLSQESKVKEILFNEKGNLKPRVKSCLDNNGTLIVVLFGWDDPDEKDDSNIKTKFINLLKEVEEEYKNSKIEICRQNQLISYFQVFPSLVLKLKGLDGEPFSSHESWSSLSEMRRIFKPGNKQIEFIKSLKQELENNERSIHIRLWGEPGIGKTRLALEATRRDDFASIIVYCDAIDFKKSELINELSRDDNLYYVILILDECDNDTSASVWDKFKYSGPRIKIISIYNDAVITSGNIMFMDVPLLDKEHIIEIIQTYNIKMDFAERWAEFCSGSPRVAHVFGANLQSEVGDLLRQPDTVIVWDRYIIGSDNPSDVDVKKRIIVLKYLALFRKFGYGGELIKEASQIYDILHIDYNTIDWGDFISVIEILKRRKILQGEYTLYITPKALHIKLWIDWWNTNSATFEYKKFIKALSPKLRQWFNEMLVYAHESDMARNIIGHLTSERGPLKNCETLNTEEGSSFFFAIAEARPKAALRLLQRVLKDKTKNELLLFKQGRRNVVWALEKIAVWRDTFHEAAELLLKLGEAENETYSNNASGVFTDLFSIIGATTETPFQDRFPLLEKYITSESKEIRLLILNACNTALMHMGSRMIGPEYQGIKKPPDLWQPTRGELSETNKKVWEFLINTLDNLGDEEKQKSLSILLSHIRSLSLNINLNEMMIEDLRKISERQDIDKRQILDDVIGLIHYDSKRLPPEIVEKWNNFKDDLTGADYPSLMKRYVSMELLEDQFDEDGTQIDTTIPKLEQLAKQSIEDVECFKKELNWLTTDEAKRGYHFGIELAEQDKDFSLLPILLDAQRNSNENPSVYFLGGYLKVLSIANITFYEKILDELVEDQLLNIYIPELTWRSILTDRASARILKLLKTGIVTFECLSQFSLASTIIHLSEESFIKWIKFLIKIDNSDSLSIALNLYSCYYIRGQEKLPCPSEITYKILTNSNFLKPPSYGRYNVMVAFYWELVGHHFVELYHASNKDLCIKLGEYILMHIGERDTIFENWDHHQVKALNKIALLYTEDIWRIVCQCLEPPYCPSTFYIGEWLRTRDFINIKKSGSLINIFPRELVLEWIDDNPKRAAIILKYTPKTYDPGIWKGSIIRELLARFSGNKSVISSIWANYNTEGWSGPASVHLSIKKEQMKSLVDIEDNYNVRKWLNDYIDDLDRRIKEARIDEERRY